MAKAIGPISGLETVGALMHPDTPWALGPEELQELPGFRKDHEANLREAKRLLAEAGYANGFKTVLTNRAVKLPYIDLGVYLISSWKKIGVEAEHKLEESATWSKSRVTRDFVLMVDHYGSSSVRSLPICGNEWASTAPSTFSSSPGSGVSCAWTLVTLYGLGRR
jgi:ABC-type transport system substrate-binding protein